MTTATQKQLKSIELRGKISMAVKNYVTCQQLITEASEMTMTLNKEAKQKASQQIYDLEANREVLWQTLMELMDRAAVNPTPHLRDLGLKIMVARTGRDHILRLISLHTQRSDQYHVYLQQFVESEK